MIDYNPNAWFDLMRLKGLSVEELLNEINSIGINSCTSNFARWRPNGTIPPLDLVKICNHFRFPISFFVRIQGQELKSRNYRLFAEDEWTDIEINTSNLVEYMVKANRLSRKEAIRKIGCSPTRYDVFRKYPSVPFPPKLTFVTFLSYIDRAHIYPGDVIIDQNEIFPLEINIRPHYDHKALEVHNHQFPQEPIALAAEDFFDVKEFMVKYLTKGSVPGDDTVVSVPVRVFNEYASLIINLRNQIDLLQRRIDELETSH